jgi:hypothetical protein
MEVSLVRKRIVERIERATRRRALDRRTRVDDARRAFDVFLQQVAVPLFRQVANVLRAEGYPFTLHTPADSVRLMSDRGAEDFIEIQFNAKSDSPQVIGYASRARASGVVRVEHAMGDPSTVTEDELLAFVLNALEPLVER